MSRVLQRVTVTRVRDAQAVDEDGNARFDAHGNPVTTPTTAPIPGCSVFPGAAPEVLGNRDTTGIMWTVYIFGAVDVLSTDRIRLPGDSREYAIDGEPLRWVMGVSLPAQTVLALRAWEEQR